MWQCGVCGTSNADDGRGCSACGAVRAPQGPAAEGLGSWPPAGGPPADPLSSWPASAPAEEFGSWSPSSSPPSAGGNMPAPAYGHWSAPAPEQPLPPPAPMPQPGEWQQWQPMAAPPGEPPPPVHRPVWIFPVIVAAVLLLAGGTVAFVLRGNWLPGGTAAATTAPPTGTPASSTPPAPTGAATSRPAPTPTTPGPPTLPASVGSIRLDPGLDPAKGPEIAALFDTYFSAVNARNAGAALGALDPSGSIDQSDPSAVRKFTDGISTSTDDDILLLSLGADPSGKGLLQARVTFRSHQEAGKGPRGRESETCTRWDVTYVLTRPGGAYRIWGSTNAGNRPC
jgi:hypothetical protein